MDNRIPKTDNIINALNYAYGDGISMVSSDILKLKLRNIFIKRDLAIKKKRDRMFNDFDYYERYKADENRFVDHILVWQNFEDDEDKCYNLLVRNDEE